MDLSPTLTISILLFAMPSSRMEYTDNEVTSAAHPAADLIIDESNVRELIIKCKGIDVSGIVAH